jgi:hypothetical protein
VSHCEQVISKWIGNGYSLWSFIGADLEMLRMKRNNPPQKFNSVIGACNVFIFLNGVPYGNLVDSLKVDRTQSKTEPCTTVYTAHRATEQQQKKKDIKISICTARKRY